MNVKRRCFSSFGWVVVVVVNMLSSSSAAHLCMCVGTKFYIHTSVAIGDITVVSESVRECILNLFVRPTESIRTLGLPFSR